jgi:hypothetical protein
MKEIKLFQKALVSVLPKQVYNRELLSKATKKGYIYDPECDENRIFAFLNTLPDNLNTTFYKQWSDVTDKTKFELFIDKTRHYASTYGTGHQGEAYIPNNEPMQIDFTSVKVIKPITVDEIAEKIQSMFSSGIALKGETINDCFELIDEFDIKIDVDSIKNKEVLCLYCDRMGVLPNNPVEMVRFLVYKHTGNTLLIKSTEVLRTIAMKAKGGDTTQTDKAMKEYSIEKLSSVFFRFKRIFLAMKHEGNSTYINQLRRAANRFHKPKAPGLWENVLSDHSMLPQALERMDELNNFKKVALLQAINTRMLNTGVAPFIIRNGKLRVEKKSLRTYPWYSILHKAIFSSLTKSLKAKACKVKLPKNLNLVLPTSEKNFIGNIPFGSYVNAPENHSIVGIYWKGDDGAQDIDLSTINVDGTKTGWNTRYTDFENRVIYSGDMTSANPEATELMYCKSNMPASLVYANLYDGAPTSKYTLFFAQQDGYNRNSQHYMVNPDNIRFMTELHFNEGNRQKMNGFFTGNRFVFSDFSNGGGRVMSYAGYQKDYIEHMMKAATAFVDLEFVLQTSGFEIVESELEADLDLSVLDKSALIELLS